MLTQDILNAVKSYTASMEKTVTLVLQAGNHAKRGELVRFLSDISGVSDKLHLQERDSGLRSPLTFFLEADGKDTGISFSGIPGGHEFNSLILSLLHAGGSPLKLDDGLKMLVSGISQDLNFEVFVSLSCHNCPDVVQALNQFALVNDNIRTEMIDGGLYPELIKERDIQGVPCVYLNGELFANGKLDAATLIDKLVERYPDIKTIGASNTLPVQDVTVIGGGPGGVSSAIYSARKGLKVTLVADRLGGQVNDTVAIENLISVPQTTGPELSGALKQHLQHYDITLKEHLKVDSIEQGPIKMLTLSSGEQIRSRSVIVATGARWRELGIPGEAENIGNGVAFCPHCDGPFFKGKDVAVIGGGNSGIEAALDLAGIVKSVTVFEFMPELKADRVLVEQAQKRDNIEILTNVVTREILANRIDGSAGVSAISYEDRASGELHSKSLQGVFVQIGLVPNSQMVEDLVETNHIGEIIVDEKCRTSAPGIFAAGDVTTVPYKQIVISTGEGAKASLAAFEYLLTQPETEVPEQEQAETTAVA